MEGKGLDPHVKSVKKKRLPRLHKKQLLLTIVLLLVVGGAGAYYFLNRKEEKKVANNQCSTQFVQDTVLRDAYPVLQSQNVDTISGLVKKIEAIPGYENDPNCMYPIVKYQILRGDPVLAQKAQDKYAKGVNDGVKLVGVLGPNPSPPSELQDQISFMREEFSRSQKQMDIYSQGQP